MLVNQQPITRWRVGWRFLLGVLAILLLSGAALAQTADEHASHHPQANPAANGAMTDDDMTPMGAPPVSVPSPAPAENMAAGTAPRSGMAPMEATVAPSSSTAAGMAPQNAMAPAMAPSAGKGKGMGDGMGMGMGDAAGKGMCPGCMGGVSGKALYPSLMEITNLTPEKRAELEAAARERIASGSALMSSGMSRLHAAEQRHDLPAMQESAVQMREGVQKFDSGVAALRAISEGQAPRSIAMGWFKDSMSLLPAQDMVAPHGLFGLTWFHYFVMLLLLAFATAMVWMNLRKMQRAQALAARLVPGARPPSVNGTAPPPIAPAPVDGIVTPPVAPAPQAADPTRATSKPNSWTGLLRVDGIFEETPHVRTLRLVDPSGEDLPFRFLPGQFVTFTVRPNDKPVKRSYTISSSPTRRGYCEVTVKREEHGTVSGFLHDMHAGDTIQTTGPSGTFTFIGDAANSVVLISGGVGITPMMSVVRYLTDRSWRGEIYFVYACRGDQDVIYREELEYLQKRHPNLYLTISASEPTSDAWPYDHGFITKELLVGAIPYLTTRHVHLCGPKPMMDAVKGLLSELEVPDAQVMTEVFIGKERPDPAATPDPATQLQAPDPQAAPGSGVAVAKFVRSGQSAMLPAGKTVLEASEDIGVNIDYSCRVGTCGVCKVKLIEGAVTMEVEDALDDQDRQNNVILACQAKATADVSVDA